MKPNRMRTRRVVERELADSIALRSPEQPAWLEPHIACLRWVLGEWVAIPREGDSATMPHRDAADLVVERAAP